VDKEVTKLMAKMNIEEARHEMKSTKYQEYVKSYCIILACS
jgi:hypothetical protein